MEKSLGIDIHGDYAALALVGKTMSRPTLLRSHWFALPLDQEPEEVRVTVVGEIRRFLDQDGSSPKHIILGLPRRDIIVHALSLPSPDFQALDGIIRLELDRHLAAPIETLQMSYHAQPLANNLYHVLVAAAKKNLAENYARWISDANLEANQVTFALTSQVQLLTQGGISGKGPHAIMDIGPGSLEISLWKENKILISRYVPYLNENLGDLFFKPSSGSEDDSPLELFAQFMMKSLELTLDGCKMLESDESLEAIHVFGGGHAQSTLAEKLQAQTEIEVHTPSWPSLIKSPPPAEILPAFNLTSLGLAVKPFFKTRFELDLNADGQSANSNGSVWKVSAVCTLLLIILVFGIWTFKSKSREATLASLNQQLDEIKPQAFQLKEIDQEFLELSEKIESLNAIDRRTPVKLPILLELSRILPKNTWVSRITIQPGKVEIKGLSASASGLIPKLEASSLFRQVTFKGSVIKRGNKENFTIQLELESGNDQKPEA